MFSPKKSCKTIKTTTTKQITTKFCTVNIKQINNVLSVKVLVLFVVASGTLCRVSASLPIVCLWSLMNLQQLLKHLL
jgi:hypothetical protein